MMPPGLCLVVSDPLWQSVRGVPKSIPYAEGYRHVIQALGGYWTASFNITASRDEIEWWAMEGLGRHVETTDDALCTCFEGFVNQVDVELGRLSETHGPLMDAGNRVRVLYTPLFTGTTSSPIAGTQTATAYADNTASQGRWGIRYKLLSASSCTASEATSIRDLWLAENREPRTTQRASQGGLRATISCLGYWHMLAWPYNQTTTSGTVAISNPAGTGKMQWVLASDPNAIFSTDYSQMVANAATVPYWENTNKAAQTLLTELTALGLSSARCVCGIYAGRRCVYAAAPTDVAYRQLLLDPAQRIMTNLGVEIKPWNVLPGRWLYYPDHYVGRTEPDDRKLDARYEFIESVTFDAESTPQVTHLGGTVDKLPQVLARLGLGAAA